jgi:hypothetical protein
VGYQKGKISRSWERWSDQRYEDIRVQDEDLGLVGQTFLKTIISSLPLLSPPLPRDVSPTCVAFVREKCFLKHYGNLCIVCSLQSAVVSEELLSILHNLLSMQLMHETLYTRKKKKKKKKKKKCSNSYRRSH